jgi:hypothetical protein
MSDETRDCGFFEKRGIKTKTNMEWRAIHDPHLIGKDIGFARERHPHPEGKMYWVICDCGARILCMDGDDL